MNSAYCFHGLHRYQYEKINKYWLPVIPHSNIFPGLLGNTPKCCFSVNKWTKETNMFLPRNIQNFKVIPVSLRNQRKTLSRDSEDFWPNVLHHTNTSQLFLKILNPISGCFFETQFKLKCIRERNWLEKEFFCGSVNVHNNNYCAFMLSLPSDHFWQKGRDVHMHI